MTAIQVQELLFRMSEYRIKINDEEFGNAHYKLFIEIISETFDKFVQFLIKNNANNNLV